ncbi:hypothetical protein ACQ4LF_25420, partial [Aeromonas salmonicida]
RHTRSYGMSRGLEMCIRDRDTLVLTLAGRFWNVNLQAGLFEFLQLNPLDGVQSAAHSTEALRHPVCLLYT